MHKNSLPLYRFSLSTLLLGVIVGCTSKKESALRLKLSVSQETGIPDTLALAGASIGYDGGSWIWAAGIAAVGRVDDDGAILWTPLDSGVVPIAVAQVTPDTLEIVDGLSRAIGTLSVSDGRQSWHTIGTHGPIFEAARVASGGWFLRTRDSTVERLEFLPRNGEIRSLSKAGLRGAGDGFVLGVAFDLAVLTFRNPKAGIRIIDTLGATISVAFPFSDKVLRGVAHQDTSDWRALGTLQFGHEMLQTLSDFRSGERLLLSLDRSGHLLRYRHVKMDLTRLRGHQAYSE